MAMAAASTSPTPSEAPSPASPYSIPRSKATLVGAATRTQLPETLPTLSDDLTKGEADVLTMTAGEIANPEIAAPLYLSPPTP